MESVNTFSYRSYIEKIKVYLKKLKLYIENSQRKYECNNQSTFLHSLSTDVVDVETGYNIEEDFDASVQNLINNAILSEEMVCLENVIKMDSAQIMMWNEEICLNFKLKQEQQMALLRNKDRSIVD